MGPASRTVGPADPRLEKRSRHPLTPIQGQAVPCTQMLCALLPSPAQQADPTPCARAHSAVHGHVRHGVAGEYSRHVPPAQT